MQVKQKKYIGNVRFAVACICQMPGQGEHKTAMKGDRAASAGTRCGLRPFQGPYLLSEQYTNSGKLEEFHKCIYREKYV